MAGENRFFEDFSRVATGAFSALSGVREEIEAKIRDQMERMFARLDMVKREEFDVVQAMAAKARAEQEILAARIEVLEAALARLGAESPAKPAPKPAKPRAPRKVAAATEA